MIRHLKTIFATTATLSVAGLLIASCSLAPIDGEEFDEFGEHEQTLAIPGVHLRTLLGQRFVGAQNNGGSTVIATATQAQGWETFTLDDLNGGALVSGDQVTIRAGSGHYFQAVNGGGSSLNAASHNTLGWERFRIVKLNGSGTIRNGDTIGLQTSSGHWISALQGGGGSVVASGAAFDTWEAFVISGLPAAGDPSCSTGIANGTACCPASCGACGGSGCGQRPGGASACCTSNILDSGVSCSGSQPPCVLTQPAGDPTCSTGIANGDACCAASCGSCGGTGCAQRPGGAEACCTSHILDSGASCSGSQPPCVLSTGSGPSQPQGRVLVRADFQNQSLGTYTANKVAADFGSTPSWNNGLNQGRASIVQEGSNRFLRVTYPAHRYGPNDGGVQFLVDLRGNHEELYLAYRVRFAPGFNFVKGGKLPGLVGGSAPSGCTTDLWNGFSARNMWRAGGQVEQYIYYPERTQRCGEDRYYRLDGSNVRFVPGRWHTIEHRIVMGTRGRTDGIMQAWIDGRMALNGTLKWRGSNATYAIDKLYFSTFFGGSDQSWAPTSQQQADFDDFIVSDRPITH